MLVIAGRELATTGIRTTSDRKTDTAMTWLTAVLVIVGTHKTHYGAILGYIAHILYGNGLWSRQSSSSTNQHYYQVAKQEVDHDEESSS